MRARRSAFETLLREPKRFRFDAMARVLTRVRSQADPNAAIRFRTPPGLGFPAAEVLEVHDDDRRVDATVTVMGLTGPSGVLPRYYSEIVVQMLRGGSLALHDFLDLLGERFVGFFAAAGIKYRPARQADQASIRGEGEADAVSGVLLALTGYGTPHLVPRLGSGVNPLLHYAGLFAMRPRSAERLESMLADWLGLRVEVVEFAGAWLQLPPDQRSRIGVRGAFCQLGVDAAVGVRAWSPEAHMVLRIGPLRRHEFEALLPGGTILRNLVSLVRAFAGAELGFAVNPVLAAREVARSGEAGALRLDRSASVPPRLGWNAWLPVGQGSFLPRSDAAEAVFDADMVERLEESAA